MTARHTPEKRGRRDAHASAAGARPSPARQGPIERRPGRAPTALQAILPIGIASGLALAVYLNTLRNGFVNDDEHQILLNPWIRSWSSILEIFTRSVWSFVEGSKSSDYYRPVMHLLYLCVFQAAGPKPWAFHLLSASLHAANTALVFLVSRQVCRALDSPSDLPRSSSRWVPLATALLFAVHPIHTEAVAWAASIPELTFTLAGLATIYLHIRADRHPTAARWPAMLPFAAALLSKETAVVLPAILGLYDISLARDRRPKRSRAAAWLGYLITTAAYLAIRHNVLDRSQFVRKDFWNLGLAESVASALVLFRDYLKLLAIPWPLNYWHTFRPVRTMASIEFLTAFLTASGFALVSYLAWRRDRRIFFALGVVVIPLLPAFYISALPAKPFAERYLYLPSAGFALAATLVVFRLASTRHRIRIATSVLLASVAVAGAATTARNQVWRDSYSLYLDTASKTDSPPLPPMSLAQKLLAKGYPREAIAQMRILVDAEPDNAELRGALGSARLQTGDTEGGLMDLRRAVELDPSSPQNLNDYAVALRRAGRADEAVHAYRTALALDPGFPEGHFNLAGLLAARGDTGEAIEQYRQAAELRPGDAYYRSVYAIELERAGKHEEALREFEEAVRLSPDEPAYRRNLERARSLAATAEEATSARRR